MKLVCITGIDGAGKTTLARSVVDALQDQGMPACYIYGRTWPFVSRLLMACGRFALLRKHDIWDNYGAYVESKKHVMRHSILAWTYVIAIWLDYYVQIWMKLLPHLFSERIVVSDRYVYDTVIGDLAVHLSYSWRQTERAIERCLGFLPTPMLTILVDLPEEVAFSRKNDVPHVDYLRERRKLYQKLEVRPEVRMLDGEKLPVALVGAVLAHIGCQ